MNRLLPFVLFGALYCALHFAPPAASAVTIDWVTVGDPGNASDPADGDVNTAGIQHLGAVGYSYRIGKYDVTNSQYSEFLNANDPTGANALNLYNGKMTVEPEGGINYDDAAIDGNKYSAINGRGDNPVNFVSWYDAVRFANWMHNGQSPGSTETGAYTLLGGGSVPSNTQSIIRNQGASFFIPNENEWYKSAYYDPGTGTYYLYPTSSNTFLGNSGNASPYGALDMENALWQWTESKMFQFRIFRGGSYAAETFWQSSSYRAWGLHGGEFSDTGFRVAAVIPEPSTGVMAGIGCCLLGLLRKRFMSFT